MGKKVGDQKVEDYRDRSQEELASEAASRGLQLAPSASMDEIVTALEQHDAEQHGND